MVYIFSESFPTNTLTLAYNFLIIYKMLNMHKSCSSRSFPFENKCFLLIIFSFLLWLYLRHLLKKFTFITDKSDVIDLLEVFISTGRLM